jgi:hypothetical protein
LKWNGLAVAVVNVQMGLNGLSKWHPGLIRDRYELC